MTTDAHSVQDSVIRDNLDRLNPIQHNRFWTPLRYAIEKGDLALVNLLLDLIIQYSAPKGDKDYDMSIPRVELDRDEFKAALKLGRVDMLAAMVEKVGAGIPLDRLVKSLEENAGERKQVCPFYLSTRSYPSRWK